MLVKNFLLLSAISIAVVSAADKHTSLRHNKKADRGLKKEDEEEMKEKDVKGKDMKGKNKNKNKNKDGDRETNKAMAASLYNFIYPDFTPVAGTPEANFNANSGYINGVGHTGANGKVIPVGQTTLGNTPDVIEVDSMSVNRVGGNDEDSAEDEDNDRVACESNEDCSSGCCAGFYGCVDGGTAAYDNLNCGN